MPYNIFRGTSASNAGNTKIASNVELPYNDTVVTHGTYYYKLQAINEHGVSELSDAIQAVSIAPAGNITITNGENVITLTANRITGADTHHLEYSDNNSTWTEAVAYTGTNPSFSISSANNIHPYWRHYGTYGSTSVGNKSSVLTYTTPTITDIGLAIDSETDTTITYKYTGGVGTIAVYLKSSSGQATNIKMNLTTGIAIINRPTVDTVLYAQAIVGFTTKNSNSLSYNAKLPIRNISASFINNNTIQVNWNVPLNSAYTGTRISWISPTGVSKTQTVAKGIMVYNITDFAEAGTYTVKVEAVYTSGYSSVISTTVATSLAPARNISASYTVATNILTTNWDIPLNNSYTHFIFQYKIGAGAWSSVTLAKGTTMYQFNPSVNGTYTVQILAYYSSTTYANAINSTTVVTMPVSVSNVNVSYNATNKQVNTTWSVPTNNNYTDIYIAYKLSTSSSWSYNALAKGSTSHTFTPSESGTYIVNVAARYGSTEKWFGEKTIDVQLENWSSAWISNNGTPSSLKSVAFITPNLVFNVRFKGTIQNTTGSAINWSPTFIVTGSNGAYYSTNNVYSYVNIPANYTKTIDQVFSLSAGNSSDQFTDKERNQMFLTGKTGLNINVQTIFYGFDAICNAYNSITASGFSGLFSRNFVTGNYSYSLYASDEWIEDMESRWETSTAEIKITAGSYNGTLLYRDAISSKGDGSSGVQKSGTFTATYDSYIYISVSGNGASGSTTIQIKPDTVFAI